MVISDNRSERHLTVRSPHCWSDRGEPTDRPPLAAQAGSTYIFGIIILVYTTRRSKIM